MSNSWFIIANPTSGNGNFSKLWKEIQQLLNNKNIDYSFAFTQYSKNEIELVDKAIQKGFRNIISLGGDGTLHNVVNGIMLQTYVKSSDITVGVIPIGTGNDWIKTYNISKNAKKSIEIISKKQTILQDIGVAKTNLGITYFNNIAGLGYDGYIVNKLNSLKKIGQLAYLISGIYGLLFYKKVDFKILIDRKKVTKKCLMVVVGICRYSGGGMLFTKDVNPTDGLFDITIVKNITVFDLIVHLKDLYTGKITNHKKVETLKTDEIFIEPVDDNIFVQADGEIIGQGKVSIKIKKRAINFIINV